MTKECKKALEEIKAEIEALECPFGSYGEWYDGVQDCIDVIDKHIEDLEHEKA